MPKSSDFLCLGIFDKSAFGRSSNHFLLAINNSNMDPGKIKTKQFIYTKMQRKQKIEIKFLSTIKCVGNQMIRV